MALTPQPFCGACLALVLLGLPFSAAAGQQAGEQVYAKAADAIFVLEIRDGTGNGAGTAT